MAARTEIGSPFLRRGGDTRGMMLAMLACLTLTAAHFALRYDPAFFTRYVGYLAAGLLLEAVYTLLRDGRWSWPHASTAVTTALLTLSVPSFMPPPAVLSGILVAVLFGKLMVDRAALRLNPMLLGRLFMMIVFAGPIQEWLAPETTVDAFTSATPLGLWLSEGVTHEPGRILVGDLSGDWEGIVAIVPGSPGETMPLLALACGVVLYALGVLDWRPGVAFLAGFAALCPLLGMPLAFHMVAGSLLFTAVYIVTDPRSMPGSKAGRWMAGLLAGAINAVVRKDGYFPEGVVIAVLAVNLLSPALDRLAFNARGWRLQRGALRKT